MIITDNIENFPLKQKNILTIGNFDGIHLGHQAILNQVLDTARQNNANAALLTFLNHPSTVLRPHTQISRLYTIDHKLKLLSKMGFTATLMLPFTKEFANQTAEEFITRLQKNIPFTHLILGHDATIGKAREGDKRKLQEIADRLGFQLEYMPPFRIDEQIVSSSLIRTHLQNGDLKNVEKLLGRPYSIYQKITSGLGFGMQIGSPTLNLDVSELCLPPLGVYIATVISNETKHPAVVNLGYAPTVRKDNMPILEAHLLEGPLLSQAAEIEVVLHEYMRPEKRFDSIEELKQQIAKDIQKARAFFKGT